MGYGFRRIITDNHGSGPAFIRNDPSKSVAHLLTKNRDFVSLGVLSHDLLDDIAEHIGQPEIAALKAIGQFRVVDPEHVQNGGV
jgi:hypothetical protein